MNTWSTRRVVLASATAWLAGGGSVKAATPEVCPKVPLGAKACARNGELCAVPPADLARLSYSAQPPPTMSVPWEQKTLIRSSSVQGFDTALRTGVLAPLAEVFELDPTFGYYDERLADGTPNAVASQDGQAGRPGTVLFGLKLLAAMLKEEDGDYGVMAVCAHEFGHIKQYQVGAHERIAAKLPCFCVELHADYLAGFAIRRLTETVGADGVDAIGRAWEKWERESCSHGSRAARMEALEAGFAYAAPSQRQLVAEAVTSGIAYLMKYA